MTYQKVEETHPSSHLLLLLLNKQFKRIACADMFSILGYYSSTVQLIDHSRYSTWGKL